MAFQAGQTLSHVFHADLGALVAATPAGGLAAAPLDLDPEGGWHEVWNLEIEEHHTYIAGGIRVHNTSVLDFLSDALLADIVPGTLRDENGDGSFDYVQIDNGLGGLDAAGGTIYKMETVDGQLVARAFVTHADAYGRLVQTTYLMGEGGHILADTIEQQLLRGADFGYELGAIVVPMITAALLGDDASVFEELAVDTIAGTFVRNLFEFGGGTIHDQIASGGLQDGSINAIANITFADFGVELAANGISNASARMTQWIMAEVFEGLETDEFAGRFASLLAQQGVNHIVDLTVSEAASALGLTDPQIAELGLGAGDLTQLFSNTNLLSLVFRAAIGTVLPALESTEAQIGSQAITLALNFFNLAGPLLGTALGYLGGLFLDVLFDEDPRATTSVGYDANMGRFVLGDTSTHDGGSEATARAIAGAYASFMNSLLDTSDARSHNLQAVASSLNLSFGHDEADLRNGSRDRFDDAASAYQARVIDTVRELHLHDGDLKVARVVAAIRNSESTDKEALFADLVDRLQTASDYQRYLQNQETYDQLIAADPSSAFAVGWAATFLRAGQYGLMAGFTGARNAQGQDLGVQGSEAGNTFYASVNRDIIHGNGGHDEIHSYGGQDSLTGGTGNDLLFGGAGNDRIAGDDGDDTLFGGSGSDTIFGGAGVDTIYASAGRTSTTVYGGAGEDMITFALGRNHYRETTSGGITTFERFVSDASGRPTARLSGERVSLAGVEFVAFENTVITLDDSYNSVLGTVGDDVLTGTAFRDAINGLEGNDIIHGLEGNDFISGDEGDDSLFGGRGDDWIFGVGGRDVVRGGTGNDSLYGGSNDDAIWGDQDSDALFGGDADDLLNGGADRDVLDGAAADDALAGSIGNDTIRGGAGDDDLDGGSGADTLLGGDEDDAIYGGGDNDTVEGGHGDDEIFGGSGTNTLYGGYGPGISGNGDDVITGGDGTDFIFGGRGDDVAFGGGGNDRIYAIGGSTSSAPFTYAGVNDSYGNGAFHYSENEIDLAYGGAGDDLIGVNGTDVAFGGAGNDQFFASDGQGRIDGGSGHDRLQLVQSDYRYVRWYKASSGEVAAVLYLSRDDYEGRTGNNFIVAVGVEEIVSTDGLVRGFGQSLLPSFVAESTAENISAAEFQTRFGEEALLSRLFVPIDYNPSVDVAPGSGTAWRQLGGGNDDLTGGSWYFGGRQRIKAGAGNDKIYSDAGDDSLMGEAGNDSLAGGGGRDWLDGGDGGDDLNGGGGTDRVLGGSGDDNLAGASGDDTLSGSVGKDVLNGGAGHDRLDGGDGDDTLHGLNGRDVLFGGLGQDVGFGGFSPDSLFGGDGHDRLAGEDGGDLLDGGLHNDTLYGGLAADLLQGGVGNDTLHGDQGNDRVLGDDGNDTLFGGSGYDLMQGGEGDDLLVGGDDSDRMNGSAGLDTVTYAASAAGVQVDLSRGLGFGGVAQLDRLFFIENLAGSSHGDVLVGSAGANQINGGDGSDRVSGLGGSDDLYGGDLHDTLFGGLGDDSLWANAGNDRLLGDEGADRLSGDDGNDELLGGLGDDTLFGGAGVDELQGGAGRDVLSGGDGNDDVRGGSEGDDLRGGAGADQLRGEDGADHLVGEEGADQLYGGGGTDHLRGDVGDDLLSGDGEADTLDGMEGHDVLTGGLGDDVLTTGIGIDRIVMSLVDGHDTVTDFTDGTDRIVLTRGAYRVVAYAEAGGTRIVLGPDASLFLAGRAPSQITTADFVTGPGSGVSLQMVAGVVGSLAANTLNGTSGADTFLGLAGDDRINAGEGADIAYGGLGNDALHGAGDALYGGDGADHFYGGIGADRFNGGSGFDLVNYQAADTGVTINLLRNSAAGHLANDDAFVSIEGVFGSNVGADVLTGNAGANRLWSFGGADRLDGGAGNDDLDGGAQVDTLHGGTGDDVLDGGDGFDTLQGGSGIDQVLYDTARTGVVVDLLNGSGSADRYDGIENVQGSNLADTILGTAAANVFRGGGGNDVLHGREGADVLIGGGGADSLNGGAGFDRVQYSEAGVGVLVDLQAPAGNTGEAAADTFAGIEGLFGSAHNDDLRGDVVANSLWGQSGNDVLLGRGGNDGLFGGDGDDALLGGAGIDALDGGSGSDRVQYSEATAGVLADLQVATANTGEAAGDTYTNVESLFGSAFNDDLRGDEGANALWGSDGNDRLHGRMGNDLLVGGAGADHFDFRRDYDRDQVNDFQNDVDTIVLGGFGFTSTAQAMARATASGANVVFDLGSGDTLVVLNTTLAALGNDVAIA